MKKCIFLLVFVCGCGSTKEYTTQCNFNVPVDKPTHTTIEIKVNSRY